MLQCPRPYFWVMGSKGVSGAGVCFAEASFVVASLGAEGSAVVKASIFSLVDVSFGQPTPMGQPIMPFCFA
jgi:hypothetical protein